MKDLPGYDAFRTTEDYSSPRVSHGSQLRVFHGTSWQFNFCSNLLLLSPSLTDIVAQRLQANYSICNTGAVSQGNQK